MEDDKITYIYKLLKAFEYKNTWHDAIKDPEVRFAAYQVSKTPLIFENFFTAVQLLEKEMNNIKDLLDDDCEG